MYRRGPANMQRKWDFLRAIIECQIGPVKVDFAKLAVVLGYKNERCAQDSYHRFRREHFPRVRGKPMAVAGGKKQYYADGRMITRGGGSSFYRDDEDEEGPYDTTGDDEDDDREEEDVGRTRAAVVKIEDRGMERAEEGFWSLGFINLEEEWEEDVGEKDKIKTKIEPELKIEPEIKKERVVEKWVWT